MRRGATALTSSARGVMATLQAAVHNWSGAMAVRFFLGAFEAAYA